MKIIQAQKRSQPVAVTCTPEQECPEPRVGIPVCALIFAGLIFAVFTDQQPLCKNLDIVWKGAAGQVDDVMDINMATNSST